MIIRLQKGITKRLKREIQIYGFIRIGIDDAIKIEG
jgi:hypothetical protein